MGAYLQKRGCLTPEDAAEALPETIAKRYHKMLPVNTEALRKGHVSATVSFRDAGRSVNLTISTSDDRNFNLTISPGVTRIYQTNPPVSVRCDTPRSILVRAKSSASIIMPVAR